MLARVAFDQSADDSLSSVTSLALLATPFAEEDERHISDSDLEAVEDRRVCAAALERRVLIVGHADGSLQAFVCAKKRYDCVRCASLHDLISCVLTAWFVE